MTIRCMELDKSPFAWQMFGCLNRSNSAQALATKHQRSSMVAQCVVLCYTFVLVITKQPVFPRAEIPPSLTDICRYSRIHIAK